ncbi:hypothetical protein [Streptomyces sp. NBRC 110028]|uniref:hypothetical protein n=1 Tax=Streptomyces sp. NBRC 110028 TaxID=1621260 RepID=UPI000A59AF79|nr:hypothetical protein [Streptomyces sp. NBRC 110028]
MSTSARALPYSWPPNQVSRTAATSSRQGRMPGGRPLDQPVRVGVVRFRAERVREGSGEAEVLGDLVLDADLHRLPRS